MADLLAHLRRQIAYDHWANQRTLDAIKDHPVLPQRVTALMAHVVAVNWLYLGRLQNSLEPVVVWPQTSLRETELQLDLLHAAWAEFFEGLSPDDLDSPIRYTNSAGEDWMNTVQELIAHVPTHSAYHRGQLSTIFIRMGIETPYTDFIEAARRGYL